MEECQKYKYKYQYPEQTVFSDKMKAKFNSLNLPCFTGINCGDILHQHFAQNVSTQFTFLMFITNLVRIVFRTFFTNLKYGYTGIPDTLFLMTNTYHKNRKDLSVNFNHAANLVKNKLVIEPSHRNNFLGFQMIKHLKLPLKLDKALREAIPEYKSRWFYISILYNIFISYKYYENICQKHSFNINKLVSNCDVDDRSYYYVSIFNKENKTTVTLQHGIFCDRFLTMNFLESKSKYFLTHNQYTIDEGVSAGYSGGKMIVTGVLSHIPLSAETKSAENPKSDIFSATGFLPEAICQHSIVNKNPTNNIPKIGYIFDGVLFDKNNLNNLEILQEYAKTKGIKLYLKLHPSKELKDYRNRLDSDLIEKCYTNDISIIDFAKKVDVIIISNSSALSEILSLKKTCFIIYGKGLVDVYHNAPAFRFSSVEELDKLIGSIGSPAFFKDFEKMLSYFCCSGSIAENYQKVFNSLGIY